MFNATFSNASVISWRYALLVEKPDENPRPYCKSLTNLSHNVVSSTPRQSGIRNHDFGGDMY